MEASYIYIYIFFLFFIIIIFLDEGSLLIFEKFPQHSRNLDKFDFDSQLNLAKECNLYKNQAVYIDYVGLKVDGVPRIF